MRHRRAIQNTIIRLQLRRNLEIQETVEEKLFRNGRKCLPLSIEGKCRTIMKKNCLSLFHRLIPSITTFDATKRRRGNGAMKFRLPSMKRAHTNGSWYTGGTEVNFIVPNKQIKRMKKENLIMWLWFFPLGGKPSILGWSFKAKRVQKTLATVMHLHCNFSLMHLHCHASSLHSNSRGT